MPGTHTHSDKKRSNLFPYRRSTDNGWTIMYARGHCLSLTLAEAAAKDLFISDNSRCAPDDASSRLCALVHVLIHSLLC